MTALRFNELAAGFLPDTQGIVATAVERCEATGKMLVRKAVMAPNGYVHAGSIVALADTIAGFGCIANLPEGAIGFTTIELKSNHVGTALEGTLLCTAKLAHAGRATHVWDATVTHSETGKTIALFRCTQMIIHGRSAQREAADRTRLVRDQ